MISGFHISASVQAPNVAFNQSDCRNQSDPLVLEAKNPVYPYEDMIKSLSDRIDKLETHVFNQNESLSKQAINDSEPEPHENSVISSPEEQRSSQPWSRVFEEVVRRLDFCASQPSVNECIASMRALKRDLNTLAEMFGKSTMTKDQSERCDILFKCKPGSEVIAKYQRKEEPVWRPQVPQRNQFVPRPSNLKSGLDGGKKWGPCFYCNCPEWRPGHSCEGSRVAEQRRKERDSRSSQ